MGVKKVFLIRHGETDFNLEGRLQGSMPVPLNVNGRLQSQALGLHLKRQGIQAIYTSPLPRAQETANLIADVIDVRVHGDPRLQETAFGRFEGLTFAQIETRYANEYRMWRSGDMRYAVPDGESRRAVQQRMKQAWDDLIEHDDHDTIAIVSHGAALKILLRGLFYRLPSPDTLFNTSLTTVAKFEDVWEIESYAQTPHLND